MKFRNIKLLFSLLGLIFIFNACSLEDEVEPVAWKDGGIVKMADPFIQIYTPVIAFQAGIPEYSISTYLVNGVDVVVKKVNVYSTYTDAKTGGQSNEVLLYSTDIPSGNRVPMDKKITYENLKNGLTVNGGPLPSNQADLAVGSGWRLRFEGETVAGNTIDLPGTINVGVLSRFAGLYRVAEASYFRIGVLTDIEPWNGEIRFIGSVDETTFSYNDFWAGFPWAGNSFRFSIDLANNQITCPILVNGAIFSGLEPISCDTHPAFFPERNCDDYNILIPDDVNNKHKISLSYGYRSASGPRAFWENLEKI